MNPCKDSMTYPTYRKLPEAMIILNTFPKSYNQAKRHDHQQRVRNDYCEESK